MESQRVGRDRATERSTANSCYCCFKMFLEVKSLSCVRLFGNPWTTAYQAPPSIHGIFQARVLEWVATSFSRGIFLSRGSNPGLPRCRRTLLPSEPLGKSLKCFLVLRKWQCIFVLIWISLERLFSYPLLSDKSRWFVQQFRVKTQSTRIFRSRRHASSASSYSFYSFIHRLIQLFREPALWA